MACGTRMGIVGLGLALAALSTRPSAVCADDTGVGDAGGDATVAAAAANAAAVDPANRFRLEESERTLTRRADEIHVFADVVRVDVTLTLSNQSLTNREWQGTLPMDPSADLIGAAYRSASGEETVARTLPSAEAGRLYGRAVHPESRRGRDPLLIQRSAPASFDMSVFPVPARGSIQVVLTFATPLLGRGSARTYRDPLAAGADPVTTVTEASAKPDAASDAPRAIVDGSLWPLKEVRLHLAEAIPASFPADSLGISEGAGSLRVVAERGTLSAPIPLKTPPGVNGTRGAWILEGSGYPMFTSTFAWRLDPAEAIASLGLRPSRNVTLRLVEVPGATTRLAPETVQSTGDPVVVTGRTWSSRQVRFVVEAVGPEGQTLGRREVSVEGRAARPDPAMPAAMEDALRAYHRARLVERVIAWAGDDDERRSQAIAFAVDVGVVRPGVGLLAVPRGERGFMTRHERHGYDTDGSAIGVDSDTVEFALPPTGSVR